MKVCIYMTLFQLGGIDSYWRVIIKSRPDITWQVFSNKGASNPYSAEGITFVPGIHWKKPFKTSHALKKYLDEHQPDALVLNGTLADILILPLIPWLKFKGIRTISVFHNSNIYPNKFKNMINNTVLSLLGWCHHTNFFVSHAVKSYWRCPGIVNTLPLKAKRRHLPHQPPKITLAFIGRLSWEKGPDLFRQVIDKISRQWQPEWPPLHVHIYGDGPMASDLTGNIMTHFGWVQPMSDHLHGIDMLLITSRTEGFPMTVLECLQAGIPILGFDVGGIREGLGRAASQSLVAPLAVDALSDAVVGFCRDYPTHYRKYFDLIGANSNLSFDLNWNQALGVADSPMRSPSQDDVEYEI